MSPSHTRFFSMNRTRLILVGCAFCVLVLIVVNTSSFHSSLHHENNDEGRRSTSTAFVPKTGAKNKIQYETTAKEYKNINNNDNNNINNDNDQSRIDTSSSPTILEIDFSSAEFVKAWKTSSKRETHQVDFYDSSSSSTKKKSAKITFYGKSSLKIGYTARRSIQVELPNPDDRSLYLKDASLAVLGQKPTGLRNFVLLSLWEDTYRLAYRSSAILLRRLGLFYPESSFVELRCRGKLADAVCHHHSSSEDKTKIMTLGVYLAIEYPSDAILRTIGKLLSSSSEKNVAMLPKIPCTSIPMNLFIDNKNNNNNHKKIHVATRNWFYFEKPANYDLLSLPKYKRDSELSPVYREIERDPLNSPTKQKFLLDQYLVWLVVNTALKNGDYDDEVFFWGISDEEGEGKNNNKFSNVGIMAWDYDNVFSPCHRKGKQAVKSKTIFCGETPIERKIALANINEGDASAKELKNKYEGIASCLLDSSLTSASFNLAVDLALEEFSAIVNQENGKYAKVLMEATFYDAKQKSSKDKKTKDNEKTLDFVVNGANWIKEEYDKNRNELVKNLPVKKENNNNNIQHEGSSDQNNNNNDHKNDDNNPAVVDADATTKNLEVVEQQPKITLAKKSVVRQQNDDENGKSDNEKQQQQRRSSDKDKSKLFNINNIENNEKSSSNDCKSLKSTISKAVKTEYKKQLPSSLSDLVTSKFGDREKYHFSLEYQFGTSPTSEIISSLDTKIESTEGLHCLNVLSKQDNNKNKQNDEETCGNADDNVLISRPLVVRSSERGKAEFGVNHHDVKSLQQIFQQEEMSKKENVVPSSSSLLNVQTFIPKSWPQFRPFPVVVRASSNDDSKSWVKDISVDKLELILHDAKKNSDAVEVKVGGYIIRGFGALLLQRSEENNNDKNKKASPTFPHQNIPVGIVSIASQAKLQLIGALRNLASPPADRALPHPLPKIVSDDNSKNPDETKNTITFEIPAQIDSTFTCGTSKENDMNFCICKASASKITISRSGTLLIKSGCLVLLPENGMIEVQNGASLILDGTSENPVSITSDNSLESSVWKSLVCSGATSKISMKHTFVAGSGISRNDKEMKASHFKHHTKSPSILAQDGCSVEVENSYFVGLFGPAFAASGESKVSFVDSLVQFAEMGGECVFCNFVSKNSAWTHFASLEHHENNVIITNNNEESKKPKPIPYEDNDNDGLYLSGGDHSVENSVIARTHDDGIDSGVSEHGGEGNSKSASAQRRAAALSNFKHGEDGQNSANQQQQPLGGTLLVINSIIEDTTHEGIAFSSTPLGDRHAFVTGSLIQRTQQALEMGYSGKKCQAKIKNTIVRDNQVGLRFGDNYYKRDQEGRIECENCTFEGNDVNVLNFVRKSGAPSPISEGKIKIKKSKFNVKKTKIVEKKQFHCREVFETFTGEDNEYIFQ